MALSTTYYWVNRYYAEGLDGLKYQQRGRPVGFGRLLDIGQEDKIQELIRESSPEDHGLNYSTWIRRSIAELIYNLYNIKIAVRTIGDYLKRWNMTPQKPVKRAIQRDDDSVKEWCEVTFPNIKQKAKDEDAEIYFLDESSVNTHNNNGKSYSPKGQKPVVQTSGSRFKTNISAAISPTGIMKYMTYDTSMDGKLFISKMKYLVNSSKGKKVFLIVDNLRSHHSKIVTEWLNEHSDQIAIFYLPAYAPDLNPVEYLNNNIKQKFQSISQPKTNKEFSLAIGKILRQLQSDHNGIKSCFRKKEVKYILLNPKNSKTKYFNFVSRE
jgi:transposase